MSRPLFNIMKQIIPQTRTSLTSSRSCATFKSPIHTDNLYPGTKAASKFDKFDIKKLPTKEQTFSGFIPMNELQFTYSHSSGPGGQNVNKVGNKIAIMLLI